MKCEIKLLTTSWNEFLKDTITHPKRTAVSWLKSFLIVCPVVLINEVITPKNDYICIGALIVCGIVLIVVLHQKCNPRR